MSGRAAFLESCERLEASDDPNLRSYFTHTRVVDELASVDSPKVLAIGMKGVGKSSAYRYLTELSSDVDVVVGLKPTTYRLHLPNSNLNFSTCMGQFERDLVLESLRAVGSNPEKLKNAVPKSMITEANNRVDSYVKKLKGLAGRFGGISILGCGFTVNDPETPVLVGLEEDREIEADLLTLSKLSDKGVTIRIVVDDPEQVFSASRDLDTHLVGGFVLAALRLSKAIKNLKVVALLKPHVFYPVARDVEDLMNYPDPPGRLSWEAGELVRVVDARLRWAGLEWTDILRGTEETARQRIEEMARAVRNGPRDLLRWVYYALGRAGGGKLTRAHIENTQVQMATASLQELETAFSSQYRGITEVLRTVFGRDPEKSYTPEELRLYLADLLVKDPEMAQWQQLPWMQYTSSHTLPHVFLHVGALALHVDDRLILPYEAEYDEEHLESASAVQLAPSIALAIR